MKKLTFYIFLLCGLSFNLSAQIAVWNFFGENSPVNSAADTFNAGLDSSNLITRGPGAAASFATNSFRTAGFQNNGIAVTNIDYFQVTLSASAGNTLSLSTIDANFGGTGTFYAAPGVTSQFAYSLDGTNFTLIGSPQLNSSLPLVLTQINLSGIAALQNVPAATTITLRYYASGQTTTGGWGFNSATGLPGLSIDGVVAPSGKATNGTGGGDWNNAATWNPIGVPTATESVTILAGDIVTTSTAIIRNAATTVDGTFQLNAGGAASGTNFTYGAAGSLNFNDTAAFNVNNSDVFWPTVSGPFNVAVLQGGLTMNSMSRAVNGVFSLSAGVTLTSSSITVNGTCQINANGFFANAGPIYGASSTLVYNSGGSYGRGFEWIFNGAGTIGISAGYPNNVTIQNGTVLDYNNGSAMTKAIAGNLTVVAGSTLSMNAGVSDALPFIVGGNVTNAGTIVLGNVVGADLRLAGNLTNTGTFDANSRAVFFTRNGLQTVSGVATIPYVVFAPTAGSTTVQLLGNLNIPANLGGNAIAFSSVADVLDLNGQTLTIGSVGTANSITGAGTFKGSAASNLVIQGTGNIGTIGFTAGFQAVNNFTLARTANAVGCVLSTALTINGALTMSGGHLDIGNNQLTLTAAATIAGANATNFIIAEGTAGAQVRKTFTAAGTFTFPIGDGSSSADGSQYSPITVNLVGGTYAAGAYVGVSVIDLKHPNYDASAEFITRYWQIANTGISTPTTFTANGTYLTVDINNPLLEANFQGNNWNGTTWLNNGSPGGAATNTTMAVPLTAGITNQITCGRRDADINVNQAGTSILNGGTYNFGSVLVGSTNAVVFTIQNIGQISLLLNAASPAPVAPFIYTTAYATGNLSGPNGTRTFTVTFTPTAGGTFNGSISIPNNDIVGSENPYVINFTGIGVVPSPEISVSGNANLIPDESVAYSALNNTDFGGALLGTPVTRIYTIQNTGTATLSLTGASPYVTISGAHAADFSVAVIPASSVAIAASTTFEVTFTPQAAGIRLATISISNNDTDENPYNFNIRGTGNCTGITNTISPASGPVGTEVLITSTASLAGATVTFAGIAATVTVISSTQIKATVPAGASTGLITTTNAQGCQATNPFTVISNFATGCEGGNTVADLFISEVTDATSGNLSYVEIYNGTGASVNLGSYALSVINNGGSVSTTIPLTAVTLANQDSYIAALGTGGVFCAVSGGDGALADQVVTGSGVNFDTNGNDYIGLVKSGITIDAWGQLGSAVWADGLGLGDRGADFKRKNNVTVPSAAYSNSDWEITDWAGTGSGSCATNDYSDIGIYNFIAGTPPSITNQPAYIPTCKSTSLSVSAVEGIAGGSALVYQWYAAAPGAASWTALTDTAPYAGTTTATLDISSVVGLDGYQFYVQVRESGSTCYTASNATLITGSQTVTWNGSTWSPSAPSIANLVVINGNYNTATSGSFECCSLEISAGVQMTIAANTYVAIENDLTVQNTAGLSVADDGSLVMIQDDGLVSNLGTMQIQRSTSPYNKFDYTYWSSPVTATTMGTAFPGWRTDYSFSFNTANYADLVAPINGFDDDGNAWQYAGPAAALSPGKGYAVMAPTTGTFPTTSTVTFSGTVNNGVITTPLSLSANAANANDDFVLLGNPYPSALFADSFISTNSNISGTLYFWTHRTGISSANPGPDANNFITTDYAMYNLTGGTSSGTGSPTPTGYVASGQGFFVEAVSSTNVVFNNSMRSKNHPNNLFYRVNQQEVFAAQRDRLWVNMERADGLFSQVLIGYFPEATMGIDRGYDGIVNQTNNSISLYSFIGQDKFRIQGRSSFDPGDLVPLGYAANLAGTYTLSISEREGQINAPGQKVYLQDNALGITHELTQGPYTFSTPVGVYDDRFVLKYQNTALGVDGPFIPDNAIVVYAENQQIYVKSAAVAIEALAIFDLTGRSLFEAKNLASAVASASLSALPKQALLVKIKLANNQIVIKKVLF